MAACSWLSASETSRRLDRLTEFASAVRGVDGAELTLPTADIIATRR